MSDYRSDAEKFVTDFIDYVQQHDILDQLNKRTQKMERSPGVDALVKQAMAVFPERIGDAGNKKLTPKQMDAAIAAAPNVEDMRAVFARKVQANGSARGLLEKVLAGDDEARELAEKLIRADKGEEFVPTNS